jgi:hypothetical protein
MRQASERSGALGPTSERAGAKAKGRSACDLYQLNILQTVVFSDHTHAVCMELYADLLGSDSCRSKVFSVSSSFLWSSY